jgi:ribosomal protein L32
MSDDCAETRGDDDLPKRLGDSDPAGFEAMLTKLWETHRAQPLQRCSTCGATYRHERGGLCYECGKRREKQLILGPSEPALDEPRKPEPQQASLLERTAGRDEP